VRQKLHCLLIAFLILQTVAGVAVAQSRYQRAEPVDAEVGQLLTRIETRWYAFRQSFNFAVSNSRREDAQQIRSAQEHFNSLGVALRDFRQRYSERRETASDVAEVMNHARTLDQFFGDTRYSDARSSQDWQLLRSELSQLAQRYNLRDDSRGGYNNRGTGWWNNRTRGRFDQDSMRLTGTYRLDPSRSEDAMRVADRVTRGLPPEQQQRIRNVIARRLESPQMLAFERDGRNLTVVSTSAPPVTFEADGRTRTEQTARGRTVSVTATVLGDQLIVSQTGDRGNDFRVTFDPVGDGRRLNVTRQLDIESLTQSIVVTSSYDKTSEVADTSIYTGRPGRTDPSRTDPSRSYTVQDGTQIVATLNENLMTQQTRAGDRFTLTVQSPPEYAGAIIDGTVVEADRSGRLAGRSEISLDFERISMRNGRSYSFEGIIESVRTPRGDTVRVNNEGTISEKTGQTRETVTRSGIGAAIGAIIGAIAGGGSGAAIGAAVGAGAGAGSIILEGRDDLELTSGTQFAIRASAPTYREDSARQIR
jgi:uncharacterized protein YcfJ